MYPGNAGYNSGICYAFRNYISKTWNDINSSTFFSFENNTLQKIVHTLGKDDLYLIRLHMKDRDIDDTHLCKYCSICRLSISHWLFVMYLEIYRVQEISPTSRMSFD